MCHRPAGAAHGDDPVCRRAPGRLPLPPPPPDAESTCINATGGRLLRAYPNVSRAGFVSPFRLAGSSRPQLRNVPSAKCRRRIRFFDGTGRGRGRGGITTSGERKIAKRMRPGIPRRNGSYIGDPRSLASTNLFPTTTNRRGVTRQAAYVPREKWKYLFRMKKT